MTELAGQFNDPAVCSDTEEFTVNGVVQHRKKKLNWRSEAGTQMMRFIDEQLLIGGRIGKAKRSQKFITRLEAIDYEENPRIPVKLSRQLYCPQWLQGKDPGIIEALKMVDLDIIDAQGRPKRGR